jgi:hypothetical protein
MKFVSAVAVVVVLIVAPIGSYFYLRAGLKYRLESQVQLQEPIVNALLKKTLLSIRSEKTASLFHLGGNDDKEGIELLQRVDERIVDRDHFEIFSNATSASFKNEKNKIKLINNDSLGLFDDIQFVLIDTAGMLRHVYNFNEDHSKSLIRHLSVVIPMPQSREIKLNREIQDL